LQSLAGDIDALPDEWTAYLNRETGEACSLGDDKMRFLEEETSTMTIE
jgi:hypothetical protein